jgi:hypothetical protein
MFNIAESRKRLQKFSATLDKQVAEKKISRKDANYLLDLAHRVHEVGVVKAKEEKACAKAKKTIRRAVRKM